MGFSIADFHHRNRSKIISEWVSRLKNEGGRQYSLRPRKELLGTVTQAFEANYQVLVHEDFRLIDQFIDEITRMRLEAGFLLSDVQNAFELYRSIVIPLLTRETTIEEFHEISAKINECLGYTIRRFSDHFQGMNEKKILEHNRRLGEEVKRRTAELKESELKYKTLVEEINDGYFVIQDEVIVFANQAFCQMHGYKMKEVLGKKFYDFVDPQSREKVIEIYKKNRTNTPAARIFEYMRLTKEGKGFPTEILAKKTRYGHRPSNIGICRDITERVKMEKRIREAERMAYIGHITTSLSHEIRNPLSAVKMNLQILKKNPQLHGNDQRRVDISVKEVIRLERILQELLDFAKPLNLQLAPSKVNQILSSCIELLGIKFEEKRLSVVSSFDPEIPDLKADGEKLGQAFINLLLNAIECSPSNGQIQVASLWHPDGGRPNAEVLIKDEGYGLPEKHLSDIFKPFFTTKSKGTGLGLSNVKRIVEAHGGWLEVGNRIPRGAYFRAFVPLEKDRGQDSRSR